MIENKLETLSITRIFHDFFYSFIDDINIIFLKCARDLFLFDKVDYDSVFTRSVLTNFENINEHDIYKTCERTKAPILENTVKYISSERNGVDYCNYFSFCLSSEDECTPNKHKDTIPTSSIRLEDVVEKYHELLYNTLYDKDPEDLTGNGNNTNKLLEYYSTCNHLQDKVTYLYGLMFLNICEMTSVKNAIHEYCDEYNNGIHCEIDIKNKFMTFHKVISTQVFPKILQYRVFSFVNDCQYYNRCENLYDIQCHSNKITRKLKTVFHERVSEYV